MNRGPELTDQYTSLIDIHSKIKTLESKYNLSRDRLFVVNQNMIDQFKITTSELRILKDERKQLMDEE